MLKTVLNLSSPSSDTLLLLNEQFIFKTIEKNDRIAGVKRWFFIPSTITPTDPPTLLTSDPSKMERER